MHCFGLSGTRPLVVVAALAFVAAVPVDAQNSTTEGMRGLLRVPSADVATPGYLHGTFWGSYARGAYEASQSVRNRPETIKFGGSQLALGYAPSPRFELALRAAAETQFMNSEAAGVSESKFGLSNLGLGVKTVLTPGASGAYRVAALVDVASSMGNQNAFAGSWDADGLDLSSRVAFTYAPVKAASRPAVRAHATAGYLNRTSDFDALAYAITAAGPTPYRSRLYGDQFQYGAGVEVPAARGWTLFTEWTGEYDLETGASFMDNPMRVTPGFRWSAPGGSIAWTSGVDVSLAGDAAGPSWGFISGISLGSSLTPVAGRVHGVVRDAETGTPVANARVASREGTALAQTDSEGSFRVNISGGYNVLEISAQGYVTKTQVVELESDGNVELEFTLPKRAVLGSIEGHLRDAQSGMAVAGRVRVQGTTEWTASDPWSGRYRLDDVPEGEVVLELESDRHRTETSKVQVSAREVATLDAALTHDPRASYGVIAGVITDAATGKPVAALVTARGASTKTASSDPVSGKYEIQLDPGPWDLSVAGAGYSARTETLNIRERDRESRDWKLPAVPAQIALEGVEFQDGTATIKRESFTALESAARFLIDNPSVAVTIEGHTDEASTPSENLKLSQRRADAVLKYLVVNHGVSPSRLDARGVGADRPLAPSGTSEESAKNRRIELIVAPASSN